MPLPRTIVAGSLLLRPLTLRDAPNVQRLAGDARLAMMTANIPHPYPRGAARAWIATHARARRNGDFVYGIERDDGTLVGALGLRIPPNAHGNVGYWIGHEYWGRGYATLAAGAGIAALFTHTGLGWLMAAHLAGNRGSARVLVKCGMRAVARVRVDHRGRRATLVLRRIDRAAWLRAAGTRRAAARSGG